MTNNLIFGNTQYRINGKIIALFRNYVSEVQKVDSVLIPIFKDYEFNNGISETELQRLYVSKNKKELEYIISLFATEITIIHNRAIEEFIYQKVFLRESKFLRKNTQIIPILNTDSSSLQIETPLFLALDTTETKIRKQQKPHQIAHHFSENSCFLVVEGKRAMQSIMDDKFYMTVRTLKTTENCDTTFIRNY
ncbi:hypothetical protein WAF17_09445 [Bernardetia sp. ABR2-2B]|uniref:hypothetical protein n=1 Tax=Bernardetia sp. ABR2-2B TaxID=3127472 RepID=UPI0030CB8605